MEKAVVRYLRLILIVLSIQLALSLFFFVTSLSSLLGLGREEIVVHGPTRVEVEELLGHDVVQEESHPE